MSLLYSLLTLELMYNIMIIIKIIDILILVKKIKHFYSCFWNILDETLSYLTHFQSLR